MIYVFVFQSVCKTGRLLISHEAPYTMGFAAEIATSVQVNSNIVIVIYKVVKLICNIVFLSK